MINAFQMSSQLAIQCDLDSKSHRFFTPRHSGGVNVTRNFSSDSRQEAAIAFMLDRLGYLWSGFPRLDLWRLGERIDGSFAVGSVGWWPRGPMMPRIHTPLFSNLQEKVHVNFGFLLSV